MSRLLSAYLQRLIGYAVVLAVTLGVLVVAVPHQTAAQSRAPAPAPAPPPAPAPAPAPADEPAAAPVVTFRGRAFDTCLTPPLSTMRAWLSSPYRAVGVYRIGWRLLPIFVGSQSPCVLAKNKKRVPIGHAPWRQGRAEGKQAVRAAQALGMRAGSALYLDMEAYDERNRRCARTTLDFVRGWNRKVHTYTYLPGFYSSADSGVRHMERARKAGEADLPSAMWFARWQTKPSLSDEPALSKRAWTPHRRIHQYAGNVVEKHGGRRMNIDRNTADAPVARIRP